MSSSPTFSLGGSLVAASVLSSNGMLWPTSIEFLALSPKLKTLLTTRGLLSLGALGMAGILRYNFRTRAVRR